MNNERWQKFSFEEQMANIGSEFFRAKHSKEKGYIKDYKDSLERIIEMLDLTVSDKKNRKRLYEILRLREVFADMYAEAGNYTVSLESLKNYFSTLALLIK